MNEAALAVEDAQAVHRTQDLLVEGLDGNTTGEHFTIARNERVRVDAIEEIVIRSTEQLITRHAKQVLAGLVHQDVTKIGAVLGEDHVGNCLDDGLEQLQIETTSKWGARTASFTTRLRQYSLRFSVIPESSVDKGSVMVAMRDIVDAFGAKIAGFLGDRSLAVLVGRHSRPATERAEKRAGF